jgi:formylglycine-generating enzyme required for sulfatase activity
MDNERMASLLISHGADIEARTTGGFTPLHWAAGKDASDAAKLLIATGADVNAKAGSDITPLHWAATKNATKVTELLITAGGDIHARTTGNLTPLHWAVKTEANDAAAIIAFTAVSQEEASNAASREVRDQPEADSDALPKDPGLSMGLPRSAFGKNPILPMGPDAELSFVWIEPLQVWIGKYEVTNNQYRQYKTDHKSLFYEGFTLGRGSQPVVYVSWDDAKKFCDWLNDNFRDRIPANCKFRLPTEEEWITAAKCGDDRTYPWGSDMPPKYGNYSDRSAKRELSDWSGIANYDDGYPVTCPVSDSGENEWGLCGLGGNVWEWCEDWYDASIKKYKTRHGGSWYFDKAESLRIDCRGFDRPNARYDTIGFRLVLSPAGS